MGKAVQLLGPERMLMRAVEVEQAGVKDRIGRHAGMIRLDQPRIGVQRLDDLARGICAFGARIRGLVQHHDIGKLDLLGQQVDQRARIAFAKAFAPVGQEIVAGKVAQQIDRIDDRHHRVKPRHVGQAVAVLISEIKGGGHRQRLGNAGGFDQQIIKAAFLRQLAHLIQQVAAQCAADAAIRHLDQLFLGPRKLRSLADQVGVDVHLGHVVDDHRHPPPLAVVQDVVQKGGLARAQKAGKDGDGKAAVGHANLRYVIL